MAPLEYWDVVMRRVDVPDVENQIERLPSEANHACHSGSANYWLAAHQNTSSAPLPAAPLARDIAQEPYRSRAVFPGAHHSHPVESRILARNGRAYFLCGACGSWIGSRHIRDPSNLATFHEHYGSEVCKQRFRGKVRPRGVRSRGSLHFPSTAARSADASFDTVTVMVTSAVVSTQSCPGVQLLWDSSPQSGYLWHLHDPDSPVRLPWTWPEQDKRTGLFWTRSDRCTGVTNCTGPCAPCRSVPELVAQKNSSVSKNMSSMPDVWRPQSQLVPLLKEQRQRFQQERLQSLNTERALTRVSAKLDDVTQIITLLSTNRIARLDYILSQALQRGKSMHAIFELLSRAAQGLYKATGHHTEREKALSLALYRLAGHQATFMMHVDQLTPSLTRVKCAASKVRLLPCLREPDEPTMARNMMEVVLLPRAHWGRVAYHIALDEIAGESRVVWLKYIDSLGGLDPRTVRGVNLSAATAENIQDVADLVHPPNGGPPTARFATQLTVAAMIFHRKDDHKALPFLVAPTGAKKDAESFRVLIRQFISVLRSTGAAAQFGMPTCIATDGDPSRRKGGYEELLIRDLRDPDDAADSPELASRLCEMLGFNCGVGDYDVILMFDTKHTIKRCGTVLRSLAGMMIASRVINVSVLIIDMRAEGIPTWKISALLKPHDAQNVPVAVELVQVLCAMGATWKNRGLDPTVRERRRTLAVFAHWYGSFLEAYVNLDLSLDEQLRRLSKFSHLSTILYLLEGTRLMSSQLYADSQTNVKSAFVHVHKQQLLDPKEPVYLIITDSDPLEELFGVIRMMGGHNPNVDIQQFCDRSGGALDLANVFQQFPEWHMGSGRRSTEASVGPDKQKPRHVRGDVIARHAHPIAMWHTGLDDAQDVNDEFALSRIVLRKHYSSTTDTLRPHGDGQYVGVKNEPDRSLEAIAPDPAVECALARPTDTATGPVASASSFTDMEVTQTSSADSQLLDPVCADLVSVMLPNSSESVSISEETVKDSEAPSFCELASRCTDPVLVGPVQDTVTLPSGKTIHKQSHIKISFNLAQPSQSKERLERVQGYRPNVLTIDNPHLSFLGPDDFSVGDMFATLIIVEQRAHVAIMECVGIKQHGQAVYGQPVSRASMAVQASRIELKGHVYTFCQTRDASGTPQWQWNLNTGDHTGIARLRPANPTSQARDIVHFTVPSSAVVLVAPQAQILVDDSLDRTVWTFSRDDMSDLVDRAFAKVKDDHLSDLPICGASTLFPYPDSYGRRACAVPDFEAPSRSSALPCPVCLEQVDAAERLNHHSIHLLFALYGIDDGVKGIPIDINRVTCVYCLNNSPSGSQCDIAMTKASSSYQCSSQCAYFHPIRYGHDKKSFGTRPTTDVPVICALCHPPHLRKRGKVAINGIPKYLYERHIRTVHPAHASPRHPDGLRLPQELAEALKFEPQELERIFGPARAASLPQYPCWSSLAAAE